MSMTENEALKIIGKVPVSLNYAGSLVEIKKAYDVIQKAIEEIQQYRAIGTIEEFKALKEKNEPKKPIEKVLPYSKEFGLNSEWKCPTCGAYVREILIDFLIHQTLIERSNILAEKEKSELYNKACELGSEKLKDNSKPFF